MPASASWPKGATWQRGWGQAAGRPPGLQHRLRAEPGPRPGPSSSSSAPSGRTTWGTTDLPIAARRARCRGSWLACKPDATLSPRLAKTWARLKCPSQRRGPLWRGNCSATGPRTAGAWPIRPAAPVVCDADAPAGQAPAGRRDRAVSGAGCHRAEPRGGGRGDRGLAHRLASEQGQGAQVRKLAIIRRPVCWLFSGWNWKPSMVSRPTTAVTGWP